MRLVRCCHVRRYIAGRCIGHCCIVRRRIVRCHRAKLRMA
jgi:hypothetical protein